MIMSENSSSRRLVWSARERRWNAKGSRSQTVLSRCDCHGSGAVPGGWALSAAISNVREVGSEWRVSRVDVSWTTKAREVLTVSSSEKIFSSKNISLRRTAPLQTVGHLQNWRKRLPALEKILNGHFDRWELCPNEKIPSIGEPNVRGRSDRRSLKKRQLEMQ